MNLAAKFLFANAFLGIMASASDDVKDRMGVGFSTSKMSTKPSSDTILNQVIPNLKRLSITNFRMYNADEDAEYVAALIKANPDLKLVVDTGYLMYRESEGIQYWDLTSDDVARYLTDYINEVGGKVKAVNGDDYEWLDNVELLAYKNEPGIEYHHTPWFKVKFPDYNDFVDCVAHVNGFVQDFINSYKDGKYKTTITVLPLFSGAPYPRIQVPLMIKSLELQRDAGAPLGVGWNLYNCNQHPDSWPGSLPGETLSRCLGGSGLEDQVNWLKSVWIAPSAEHIDINPDDIKLTVTETGYATGGLPYANEYLAGIFYNGLISKMEDPSSSLHGVDIYFFEALDEDLKPGIVEPYWGLMDAEGNLKQSIDQYWPSIDEDGNIITEDTEIEKEETDAELYTTAPIVEGNLRATSA